MRKCRRFFAALLCCILLLSAAPAYAAEAEPIRIAFLDSGISLKHLDPSRVEEGENLVFPGRDTDDRIGHGTATAGIVLGSEDLGLPGLCPEAVVVPLVCYDRYPSGVTAQGSGETLAQAIRLAVDRYDCRIINISMGMTEDDPALREAVEYALAQGTILVSAVGNQNETAPERVYYPAAYAGVIGVGAANGEEAAAFSQRNNVDVLAQGVDLPTVTNRNSAKAQTRSGTSFACAVVSGLCAAIWAAEPELSADQVRERLYAMAKDIGEPGFDTDSGWGIVSTQPDAAEDTPDTEPASGADTKLLLVGTASAFSTSARADCHIDRWPRICWDVRNSQQDSNCFSRLSENAGETRQLFGRTQN
ncbi:MAG: S8 family peptidase [Oscillospiraceae bacterium]